MIKLMSKQVGERMEAQRAVIMDQQEEIDNLHKTIDYLLKEISKRDQMISDQQKRMRFFGIEIANEEYHPDPVDFPSVIKL